MTLPETERGEQMGRDRAGTGLVREGMGSCTGSAGVAGTGVGAASTFNPVGQSSQHCRLPDVDGTAENGDGRIMNWLPVSM